MYFLSITSFTANGHAGSKHAGSRYWKADKLIFCKCIQQAGQSGLTAVVLQEQQNSFKPAFQTYLDSTWCSGKASNQTSATRVLGPELVQSRASASLIPVVLHVCVLVEREKKGKEQTKGMVPLFLVLPQLYCFTTECNKKYAAARSASIKISIIY